MTIALEDGRVLLAKHLRYEVIRYPACAKPGRERVTQLIDREVLNTGAFQCRCPSLLEAADVRLARLPRRWE